MKPKNPIYLGGPPLDPPDDDVSIQCTYCLKNFYAFEWRCQLGECPNCHRLYAGKPSED